eukprot:765753-Hanusia_phi.AAC.2
MHKIRDWRTKQEAMSLEAAIRAHGVRGWMEKDYFKMNASFRTKTPYSGDSQQKQGDAMKGAGERKSQAGVRSTVLSRSNNNKTIGKNEEQNKIGRRQGRGYNKDQLEQYAIEARTGILMYISRKRRILREFNQLANIKHNNEQGGQLEQKQREKGKPQINHHTFN